MGKNNQFELAFWDTSHPFKEGDEPSWTIPMKYGRFYNSTQALTLGKSERMHFSPDGKIITVHSFVPGNLMPGLSRPMKVMIIDADRRTVKSELIGTFATDPMFNTGLVAFSEYNQYYAMPLKDIMGVDNLAVFDTNTGIEIARVANPVGFKFLSAIEFSPDSSFLATGWTDFSLRIWAFGASRQSTPQVFKTLPVTLRPQGSKMWCWAASGEMVMEYQGKHVAQCQQAIARFGINTCCNSPTPQPCIQGGWAEYNKWGFASDVREGALSWLEIQQEIDANRPFTFTWKWTDGTKGGHTMVCIGYSTVNNVNYVKILDPWPVNQGKQKTITYDDFVQGEEYSGTSYSHWKDYYHIRKSSGLP